MILPSFNAIVPCYGSLKVKLSKMDRQIDNSPLRSPPSPGKFLFVASMSGSAPSSTGGSPRKFIESKQASRPVIHNEAIDRASQDPTDSPLHHAEYLQTTLNRRIMANIPKSPRLESSLLQEEPTLGAEFDFVETCTLDAETLSHDGADSILGDYSDRKQAITSVIPSFLSSRDLAPSPRSTLSLVTGPMSRAEFDFAETCTLDAETSSHDGADSCFSASEHELRGDTFEYQKLHVPPVFWAASQSSAMASKMDVKLSAGRALLFVALSDNSR